MENTENLEDEIWKQHPIGIWVSSKGKILAKRNGVNYGYNHNKGYKQVCWKGKTYKVHRLVAECFIPNHNNLPMINHKDENKANNCVENLEWCDNKYNLNYGNAQTKRVENTDYKAKVANTDYKAFQAKRVEKISIPIQQYTRQGELVKEWQSAKQVERELGYNNGNINSCCNGKRKSAYGFIWRY